jgi:hypothetical protein
MAIYSSDLNRLKTVQEDSFIKTKSNILEVLNQLRLFRFLKLNPEYQDAKYINFNTATNRSTAKPKAVVDIQTKKLKLPLDSSQRLAVERFNFQKATATIEQFGGGILTTDPAFPIENSMDESPDTFWFVTVMSDGIPSHRYRVSHSANRQLGSGIQYGNVFESKGMIFSIEYNFSKSIYCNQIKLFPIANYPVRVIDLAYKTNELSTDWLTVPNFDPLDYEETLSWIEWNGPRFGMVTLKLVIEQQNYEKKSLHLPKNLAYNNQLWSQIANSEYNSIVHNIELTEIIADKIAVEPSQLLYLNELNDLGIELSDRDVSNSSRKIEVIDAIKDVIKKHANQSLEEDTSIIEIKNNFYTCGLRSVEINDNVYQPFGFYESQKFESNANILEVSIETNETHRTVRDGMTANPFYRTSIEWELQTSDNTVFPIVPIQYMSEIYPTGTTESQKYCSINDEMLIVNRQTFTAITRFPVPSWVSSSSTSPIVIIRRNGNRLSPIVINSRVGGQPNKYNYKIEYITNNGYRYIKVVFNSETFDGRSIYTISYQASYDSAVIDLNSLIDSERVIQPEAFNSTDRDNKVQIKYYPYVEYEIVNSETAWTYNDNGTWTFTPSYNNYAIGQVSIDPANQYRIVGTNTTWLTGVTELLTGAIEGRTGAHFKFVGDSNIYKIQTVQSNTGILLDRIVETGFLSAGAAPTGLRYVIGKTIEIDNTVYGLEDVTYEPIKVYVNDIKAINKTNYESLEYPAFTPQDNTTRSYEYIQAGKNIYFNVPINGKIEVDYRYLTQYIKVNALLRSNKVIKATDTPIVEDYTIRIKNSKI